MIAFILSSTSTSFAQSSGLSSGIDPLRHARRNPELEAAKQVGGEPFGLDFECSSNILWAADARYGAQLYHTLPPIPTPGPARDGVVADLHPTSLEDVGALPRSRLRQVPVLNPNGDGFLAVRTGPGAQYRKIDELQNGDIVLTCDARGPWIAIVYGPSEKMGWVHGKWLTDLAG